MSETSDGDPVKRRSYATKVRSIRIEGDLAYVPLTRGHEAVIDAADVSLVEGFNWAAVPNWRTVYAMRSGWIAGKRTTIYMHRAIAPQHHDFQVDHIDGDGLNNRRRNLRSATVAENSRNKPRRTTNSSGFKGVSWCRRSMKWLAYITFDSRQRHLGYFDTAEAASVAYGEAALRFHGSFARLA